jgi:hypothetical protein
VHLEVLIAIELRTGTGTQRSVKVPAASHDSLQ